MENAQENYQKYNYIYNNRYAYYLEGFENGWERKEGGGSAFGVSEYLADKYVNR